MIKIQMLAIIKYLLLKFKTFNKSFKISISLLSGTSKLNIRDINGYIKLKPTNSNTPAKIIKKNISALYLMFENIK